MNKSIELDKNKTWIASFDPGSVNFSFCIEEVDIDKLKSIKKLKLNRSTSKLAEEQYEKNLDILFTSSKNILVKNTNLTKGCDKSKYIDLKVCYNITEYLDSYKEYFANCSYIVVEQQMSFGKKKNTLCVKIAQHILSYFIINYHTFKIIVEYPSYNKTQVLNAPKKMNKPERKKWAIKKAIYILDKRGDKETSNHIENSKKKDDLADTIVMTQSFIYTYLVLEE
jgi:hypothetical protein